MKVLVQTFVVMLCFCSCKTLPIQNTSLDLRIKEKQEKIQQDGRVLLAKANEIFDSYTNVNDPRLKQAFELLEKSQELLGVTMSEKARLAGVEGHLLNKEMTEIYNENVKISDDIKELQTKNNVLLQQITAREQKYEAILNDQRASRVKWYFICSTIVLLLGAVMWYVPSGFIKTALAGVANILKFNTSSNSSKDTTNN